MLLNNIPPRPALKDLVRFYRIIHFDYSKQGQYVQHTKAYRPRIEHCLQFTPFDTEEVRYDDEKPVVQKTALFGQHTILNSRVVGKKYLNVQVVFQPGVLPGLLGHDATDISNVYTDARNFLKEDMESVNEQLSAASNYPQMIEIVELFLLELFRKKQTRPHATDDVAKLMLNPYDSRSIEWYASQSNLCYRQFDRMFKARTGITPTEYRSLVRLDLAYLLKNRSPQKDWFSIAIESGFYDYQHLARNYKKFTGYSPAAFFELEQKAPERYFGDHEQ